jgi:hypothetical protein
MRAIVAVVLAALTGLVLYSRVYRDFDSVRLKIVTASAPATNGAIDIVVPPFPRLAEISRPAVLIVQLEAKKGTADSATAGDEAKPSPVRVTWNGILVDTLTFETSRRTRHDIVLPATIEPRAGDVIRLRTFSGEWSLAYLELANLHGSSRGIVDFVILPVAAEVHSRIAWPFVLLLPVALLVLMQRPGERQRRRALRIAYLVVACLIVLLLFAALLSPVVSPFMIVLGFGTVVEAMVFLCWSGFWRLCREARAALARRTSALTADALIVSALVFGLFLALTSYCLERYDGNYSGLMQMTDAWAARSPVLTEQPAVRKTLFTHSEGGYDGQFMYMMAFDPFLLRYQQQPARYLDMVDTPPYRYGRIGFSLLIKLFSFDQPPAYPRTMVWLILASHFVAVLLLASIAIHHGRHPAWALLYLAIPGLWMSMRTALPESIAAVGLLAGYLLVRKSRFGLAAIAFAASLLVRETGLILVVCLAAWWLLAERRLKPALWLMSSLLPFAAWRVYVGWRLFPVFGREGMFFRASILDVPFRGMVETWHVVGAGTYLNGTALAGAGAAALTLVVTALAVLAVVAFWQRRDALTGAMACYALLAVSLDYPAVWVYWGSVERTTYELFLLSIVFFISLDERWPRLQRAFLVMFGAIAVYSVLLGDSARDLQAIF